MEDKARTLGMLTEAPSPYILHELRACCARHSTPGVTGPLADYLQFKRQFLSWKRMSKNRRSKLKTYSLSQSKFRQEILFLRGHLQFYTRLLWIVWLVMGERAQSLGLQHCSYQNIGQLFSRRPCRLRSWGQVIHYLTTITPVIALNSVRSTVLHCTAKWALNILILSVNNAIS
jgi:hypothetical protein